MERRDWAEVHPKKACENRPKRKNTEYASRTHACLLNHDLLPNEDRLPSKPEVIGEGVDVPRRWKHDSDEPNRPRSTNLGCYTWDIESCLAPFRIVEQATGSEGSMQEAQDLGVAREHERVANAYGGKGPGTQEEGYMRMHEQGSNGLNRRLRLRLRVRH